MPEPEAYAMADQKQLDYRSDTFTKPTPAMRAVMAEAEVGDDVFDEDPSIHRLQDHVADLLGKEAALFFPSGSMSNQVAIRVHCQPGDEFICEAGCHIYNYEQAAFAQLSGVVAQTIEGEGGVLRPEQLQGRVRADNDHLVRTRLVTLENTHNRGAGRIQPYENVEAICAWAHENGLITHLDGARLFNAVIATDIEAKQWAQHFDTVSICFSKGLGAPVGSALAGSREAILSARRHRKCFGGGMRQAGILAAAAHYALDNHIDRLTDDHHHARQLADAIAAIDGLTLTPSQIDTNMIIFEVAPELGTAESFVDQLAQRGLHMLTVSPTSVRAVTHLDLPEDGAERASEILREVAGAKADSPVA